MLSWPALEGQPDIANNDLRALEDMFPDVDHAVINDVYEACDQDIQRSMQALWGMTGGVSSEDMPFMNPDDSTYYDSQGYDSDYMLGNMSLAEWTAKLESISWQDAVRAISGTLTTVGTNVTQGLTALAENLTTWVADISGTGEDVPEDEDNQRRSSSGGSFIGDGAPQPQGMQRSAAARAGGSESNVHLRRHEKAQDFASPSASIGSGSRSGAAKKDD